MKIIWSIIVNLIKLFDNFINVVFAPLLNWMLKPEYKFGYYRDPLSEVFGRNVHMCSFCKYMCKFLSVFENKHCKKSIEEDSRRAMVAKEIDKIKKGSKHG